MANFVLVHGAWSGGWCYRETAQALRLAGHNVFTPTHTGLGDRFHQFHWDVSLFRYFAASVEGRPGWRVVTLPAGHAVMIDAPDELATELLRLV